jgi:hypothetical protein
VTTSAVPYNILVLYNRIVVTGKTMGWSSFQGGADLVKLEHEARDKKSKTMTAMFQM